MKILFENWRKFLKEEEAVEKLYKALGEDQQKIFKTLTVEQQLDLAMEWEQDGKPGGLLMEAIDVDVDVGDVILGGKYKNKRMVVKEIGKDELGQPTVNGKPMLKFRIEKHLPDNKKSKKTLDAEKENLDEAKVSKSVLKTLRAWPKGWRGAESPGKYYGNFKKSDWTADDKGYIEDKGRGYYILSDLGREILAANPPDEEKLNEFENWREFLNEKMMLKPGENGWDLYRQLVGQAYMDAPEEQPEASASYEALGEWVKKFFERVVGVVDVEFVDYHPYKSSKQMIKQVQEDGVLLISTADAEHPIFDAETNAKFRTVHDFGGHVQRKVPFSFTGELKAYNTHVKMVPPVAVPALFTEIVGQISCFYLNNKTNCPQKMVILDQFDFVNVGAVKGYKIVNKELIKDESPI